MKGYIGQIAASLLIVFALGGFVGPLVHRVHHTLELEAATKAAHDHPHPQDGASRLVNGVAAFWFASDCVLCAPLIADVTANRLSVAAFIPAGDSLPASEALLQSAYLDHSQARAPPKQS